MRKVRVVRVPFMLPTWAAAQVLLPGTIFVRGSRPLTRSLLAHELVHVEQVGEMGLLRFWWRYLFWLLRYGYHDHPLELDAMVRSAEPELREWADAILAEEEGKVRVAGGDEFEATPEPATTLRS